MTVSHYMYNEFPYGTYEISLKIINNYQKNIMYCEDF